MKEPSVIEIVLSVIGQFMVLDPTITHEQALEVPAIQETICMAQNVWFEARSETEEGKSAVAHVTLTRAASKHFPSTICGVVQAGYKVGRRDCAFSWFCDGKSDNISFVHDVDGKTEVHTARVEKFRTVVRVSLEAILGKSEDPTNGSTHYYAHDIVTPNWLNDPGMEQMAVVDNHTFIRNRFMVGNEFQGIDFTGITRNIEEERRLARYQKTRRARLLALLVLGSFKDDSNG